MEVLCGRPAPSLITSFFSPRSRFSDLLDRPPDDENVRVWLVNALIKLVAQTGLVHTSHSLAPSSFSLIYSLLNQ